jgi:hypothetical protein
VFTNADQIDAAIITPHSLNLGRLGHRGSRWWGRDLEEMGNANEGMVLKEQDLVENSLDN